MWRASQRSSPGTNFDQTLPPVGETEVPIWDESLTTVLIHVHKNCESFGFPPGQAHINRLKRKNP